jgi:regulator of RNase E activity RraA
MRVSDRIRQVLFHDRLVIAAGPGCKWARPADIMVEFAHYLSVAGVIVALRAL